MSAITGNVGIGTRSPQSKLDVNGAVRGTAFNTVSDARWKEQVEPLRGALDGVLGQRSVTYRWNERYCRAHAGAAGEGRHIGFIAQEVEKVLPELVSTAPDGYKSLDYARFL